MTPTVSVVMPVYNGERFIAEAIASVLGQTYADFELIIVDDGSSDASARIAQEYAGRDTRIRFISTARNAGQGSARNRGIATASGEYLAMMDGDDICLPDRLRKQIDYLERNPQVGAIGCSMWAVDQDLAALFRFTVPEEHALITWNLFFGWSIAGPAIMIRRELMVAANGYEEGRAICDDLELLSRLVGRTRLANLPDSLMLYRRHPHADSVKKKAIQRRELRVIMRRMLHKLWGEAPEATIERFLRVRSKRRDFRRAERNLLRAEMTRLIESFVDAGWVQADERPLLVEAMEDTLQRTMPRRRHFWRRLL